MGYRNVGKSIDALIRDADHDSALIAELCYTFGEWIKKLVDGGDSSQDEVVDELDKLVERRDDV